MNRHTCKDCCYFDPDNNYCQCDGNYNTISPKHSICKSFTSDTDEYDNLTYRLDDFDENEYGYSENYD